ncbi:MAG: hypothetical protein Q4G40_09205 [Brachybacterium sp.]|nr:hypothetical protein [Brachybacterium sp.]
MNDTPQRGRRRATPNRIIADPKTRRWLYAIAVAVVPILIVAGVIAEDHGGLWLTLVGAVLAVPAPALAAANTPDADG